MITLRPTLQRLGGTALAAVFCAGCQSGAPDPFSRPTPQPRLDAATVSPELGQQAFAHAAALTAMGPRHTGSPGWGQAIDYIVSQCEDLGIEVRIDSWTDRVERLTFTNVIATLPGVHPEKIVLGAHHDTKCTQGHEDPDHNYEFVGANDSASGVGLLLALAAELRERPRLATIEFVFFDGEESVPYTWDITRALFGSRRYVRRYQQRRLDDPTSPGILAMVLLDMVGAADLQIDRETQSTPGLQNLFMRAAVACGHQSVFFHNELEVTDDHVPFLNAGIPAIDLIDIVDNPQWHTPQDTLDTLAPESFQVVGQVTLTALPAIARDGLGLGPGGPDRTLGTRASRIGTPR